MEMYLRRSKTVTTPIRRAPPSIAPGNTMNPLTPPARPIVRSYRDLIVWQRSVELAVETYRLTDRLPLPERFGLSSPGARGSRIGPGEHCRGGGAQHNAGVPPIAHDRERFLEGAGDAPHPWPGAAVLWDGGCPRVPPARGRGREAPWRDHPGSAEAPEPNSLRPPAPWPLPTAH